LFAVALWGNFTSSFLYYLLFATFWFAAIGAIDDYAKIRYQNSDKGLSRGAKYLLQIGFALIFGFLFLHPTTSPLPHPDQASTCRAAWPRNCPTQCHRDEDCQRYSCAVPRSTCVENRCQPPACLSAAQKPVSCTNSDTCIAACGQHACCHEPWRFQVSAHEQISFQPSQFYIPFRKSPLFDLSWLYILVIIFFIVYSANSVNFADGLDGLATVPSLFAFSVYGIYAYLFGNAILSRYLWYPVLPGAGEAAVFCGAVVGALLGFLWFNAYPAELFMGDTGSMALGGALGTLMILLKQEVLFLILGGIFLAELISVVIQDWLGIQILGRRILYRAPIHHTFQHRGIAETKIVVRFWIIAGMLALLSLAALKIR
jgi:UDP-N-acetylmuramyl pentapeptide phosphotransferase/UDP-N-acetylglucosamine-1-phosphate transferase